MTRIARKRFTYVYAYCETCDVDREGLHRREVAQVQAWVRRHVLTTGHAVVTDVTVTSTYTIAPVSNERVMNVWDIRR